MRPDRVRCSEDGCTDLAHARCLCRQHYDRLRHKPAGNATRRLRPAAAPEQQEANLVQTRPIGVVVLCPHCARRHIAPLEAIDAGWWPAACRRGGLVITGAPDEQARGGRHRAKEPTPSRSKRSTPEMKTKLKTELKIARAAS